MKGYPYLIPRSIENDAVRRGQTTTHNDINGDAMILTGPST